MSDETPIADQIVNGQSEPKPAPVVPSGPQTVKGAYTERTVDVIAEDPNRVQAKKSGGVFLDEIQKRNAEFVRAKVEGREPDLENPGPIASTKLRPPNA